MRARDNDAEAWERLVTLYAPLTMHWCRRWGLGEAEAADVLQETFRVVATKLESFRRDRPGDTFRGWLRTIARNKMLDHHRALRGEPKAAGGTDAHIRMTQVEEPPEIDDDDEQEVAAQNALVRRALEQIKDQFQQRTWNAFWRTAVDGQSAVDVGDELGMSAGAVRVAKSRVLQRLRSELGELIE